MPPRTLSTSSAEAKPLKNQIRDLLQRESGHEHNLFRGLVLTGWEAQAQVSSTDFSVHLRQEGLPESRASEIKVILDAHKAIILAFIGSQELGVRRALQAGRRYKALSGKPSSRPANWEQILEALNQFAAPVHRVEEVSDWKAALEAIDLLIGLKPSADQVPPEGSQEASQPEEPDAALCQEIVAAIQHLVDLKDRKPFHQPCGIFQIQFIPGGQAGEFPGPMEGHSMEPPTKT